MEETRLAWIVKFIWGIASDVLRDVYVHGKYRERQAATAATRIEIPEPKTKVRQKRARAAGAVCAV